MKPRMATDDERREVARRLRSFVTDDSVYADVDACRVLHSIGLYYKDIDRIYFSGFDVARLADLIDPGELKTTCIADLIDPDLSRNVPEFDSKAGEGAIAVKELAVDRDALLEEAKELEKCARYFGLDFDEDEPLRDRLKEASEDFAGSARRIREACGEGDE